jgi:hypothetical protein
VTDLAQKLRDRKRAIAWSRSMDADYPTKWGPDALCQQAADEIERLRAEVAEWEKLRDPEMLHANLLRGIPCQLDRATFLHLAGDETPNVC